jgi:hypothetical protein
MITEILVFSKQDISTDAKGISTKEPDSGDGK